MKVPSTNQTWRAHNQQPAEISFYSECNKNRIQEPRSGRPFLLEFALKEQQALIQNILCPHYESFFELKHLYLRCLLYKQYLNRYLILT